MCPSVYNELDEPDPMERNGCFCRALISTPNDIFPLKAHYFTPPASRPHRVRTAAVTMIARNQLRLPVGRVHSQVRSSHVDGEFFVDDDLWDAVRSGTDRFRHENPRPAILMAF